MNALQDLMPLWVALVGAALVWRVQGVMRQANDEFSAFVERADLHVLGR